MSDRDPAAAIFTDPYNDELAVTDVGGGYVQLDIAINSAFTNNGVVFSPEVVEGLRDELTRIIDRNRNATP